MQPRAILALLAIAAFVMAAGPPAHGGTYTWTGNSSTDWSVEGNWFSQSAAYPNNSGDTATIGNQANDPVLTEHIIVGSLTMNGGQLDMDDGTAHTLSVDGTFEIGANGATLGGSGGTIRAEIWSIGGTISFGEGTYECGAV